MPRIGEKTDNPELQKALVDCYERFFDSCTGEFVNVRLPAIQAHLHELDIAALISLPVGQPLYYLYETGTLYKIPIQYARRDQNGFEEIRSIYVADEWIGDALIHSWNTSSDPGIVYVRLNKIHAHENQKIRPEELNYA